MGEQSAALLARLEQDIGELNTIADSMRNAARDAGDWEEQLLAFIDSFDEILSAEERWLYEQRRSRRPRRENSDGERDNAGERASATPQLGRRQRLRGLATRLLAKLRR
jgi:hypothetical protein